MNNEFFKFLDEPIPSKSNPLNFLDEYEESLNREEELNNKVQSLLRIHNPKTREIRVIAATELIKEAVLDGV